MNGERTYQLTPRGFAVMPPELMPPDVIILLTRHVFRITLLMFAEAYADADAIRIRAKSAYALIIRAIL